MPSRPHRHQDRNKPNTKFHNTLPTEPSTTWGVLKSKTSKISSFIAALFLGLGVPMISTGNLWAPWLISIGILMIAILIMLDDDVRRFISNKSKPLQRSIYISAFVLPFICALAITMYVTYNQRNNLANTPIFYGILTPNNEATLLLNIPKGDIGLMMGDSFTVVTSQSNSYIFSEKNNPFLTISIKPNGDMMLTTEVTDSNGNVIVDIVKNKFQANQNYAFFPLHPNHYTLSVNDLSGTEVLNVDYMNPKVMRITGNFRMSGYSKPVIISADGIIFPSGQTLSGDGSMKTIINITKSKDGFIEFQ